ncbi:hypothetical protein IJG90_04110 [Candidatus Saccharibacteria bacterium]|nr:hypothetical protein [Candidatus Saccharibacteria bacterium]
MDDFKSFRKKAEEVIMDGWQMLTEQKDGETEDKKMQKREKQLVNILMTGDTEELNAETPKDDPAEREMVLEGIRDGRITNQYWERILKRVSGPLDEEAYDKIFREMADDKHMRKILAATIGAKMEDYGITTRNSVIKFAKQYPTPIKFDKEAEVFLEGIRATNSDGIYQDYVDAMDDFKHAVYGEKQDYWDAAKMLMAEAEAGLQPEDESKVINAEKLFRPEKETKKTQKFEPEEVEINVRAMKDEAPKEAEVQVVDYDEPEEIVFEEDDADAESKAFGLSQEEQEAWAKRLIEIKQENGKILITDVDKAVSEIESPLKAKTAEELLADLNGDEKKLQILARAVRKKMSEYNNITVDDVENFKKRFDTAVKFDMISDMTLNTIRRLVGDEAYRGYEKAMAEFKHDMYGKQQDYVDAMKK